MRRPPSPSQLAAQWNYVELVKAPAAYWCGSRFWRRFRLVLKRRGCACSQGAPLFFHDVSSLPGLAATSSAVLRSAAQSVKLTNSKDGLCEFADHAVAVRTSAPTAIALSGIRRASEVAQLLTRDVMADPRKSGKAEERLGGDGAIGILGGQSCMGRCAPRTYCR